MRYRKKPIDYLGQIIAIASVLLCAKYIESVTTGFEMVTYVALAMGFACLFSPILFYQIPIYQEEYKPNWLKSTLAIWSAQIGLLFLTAVVFGTFIWQTRLNPKFQSISAELVLVKLQQAPVFLWFSPWLLYTFLAVAFGYYCLIKKRPPWLPGIILPNPKTHHALFAENYLFAISNIANFLVVTTLYVLGVNLLCEGVCLWVGFPSLFESPFQAPIIALIVFFLVAKLKEMNIHWMLDKKWNLGWILLAVTLTFSLIFLWLHNLVSIVTAGNFEFPVGASELLGSFSEENLNSRLQALIWGWMLIWAPLIASWFTKQSQGFKVWQVLPMMLLLPCAIGLSVEVERLVGFLEKLSRLLAYPIIQVLLALGALALITTLLYRVHNLADLNRAYLPPTSRIREKALIKIVGQLSKMITISISGVYMLGWPVFQVMFMAAALFMVLNLIWLFGLFLKDGAGEYTEDAKKPPAAEQQV